MAEHAPGFVHLHNHTTYSLLDGAQRLDEMLARAASDGQTALAITDHGNLFGVLEFARKAERAGIRPVVGIEAYVAPGSRHDRSPNQAGTSRQKPYYHLILLAESYTGYKNLIRLATAGFLEGFYYRPRVDKELLAAHREGIVCLSACLAGEVATHLRNGQLDRARAAAGELRDLFGRERFWLELQDHGLEDQKKVNAILPSLARELGVGLVATNDCHYLLPEDHFAHDVLVCIQTGKTIHARDRMRYTPQHYLKTQDEMRRLFSWAPEAVANTVGIAERCRFACERQGYHLPDFPVPPGFDLDSYFEKVVRDGLEERSVVWRRQLEAGELRHPLQAYRDRLDREIRTIRAMGFSGYFLVVWDFVRFARERGIPVGPGRGSAAGSLVAYCLKITDIDPMQYDLLFERFLNPERVSLPDIDIDFCFRRRQEILDYVTENYGRPNVAQIIAFGTLAARAAIRDVGRGLDIPYGVVDRIAKLVPQQPGADVTIEGALREVPALRQAYESDPAVRQLLDVARRLEGLVRHVSTHPAGVVIAPRPVSEFAPLYKAPGSEGDITTQYAMADIEEIGLLKMDLLGLKTLTLIEDALRSIERSAGARPDFEALGTADPEVFELFCRGRTSGIFQFESAGMRSILRRFKPRRFEDLVALNALYRPGPIGGGLIDEFIERRHGKERVAYPHPLLEEILRDTYGVIVYQEQVMQIASRLAGYSLGEADILRRAMGKKNKEAMAAERDKFVARATANGVSPEAAREVFDRMEYFGGYGFNKSHSAAYALVAYRTAWLKVHYPVHFMAALLTTEKASTDKLVSYIAECRDMGIPVLPPDVNRSELDFTVEGEAIRFGLSAIKNVGEAAIRSVLEARARCGRFQSLHDLAAEVDPRLVNKRVIEALVLSGALDGLGARRSQLLAVLDEALEHGQRVREDRQAGQSSLFGGTGRGSRGAARAADLPDVPEWEEKRRLDGEKATLGFYVSGHPLERYREVLDRFATHTTASARECPAGVELAIGGIVTDFRRRRSKKGQWWASFQVEDLTGAIEVLLFPKAFETCADWLDKDRLVFVSGRLAHEEERLRLLGEEALPLEELEGRRAEGVQVRLDASELDDELIGCLRRAVETHRGEAALYLEVVRPQSFRLVARAASALRVRPSAAFAAAIEELLGPGRIVYRAALPRAARRTSPQPSPPVDLPF